MILTVPVDESGYPTLGPQVVDWMQEHLVFGPGDLLGEPLRLDQEQQAFIWRMYEVFPREHPKAGRRRFRRCAISIAKGLRKTELGACIAAAELHPDAPVRFNGWVGDDLAQGKGVSDPFVALVAYTEQQSSELAYAALKIILEHSPIAKDFDCGLERIERVHGSGKAVSLAGSPNARDGARTTWQLFDEPLALDTEVPTSHGWKTIGAIEAGDVVYGRDGSPTAVVGVSAIKHDRPCYRVTFTTGHSVVTDATHRWTAIEWSNRPKGEVSVTTEQMYQRGVVCGNDTLRWRLPRGRGFDGVEAELPVDPYLLGLWIGDGATLAGYIHNALEDYEVLSASFPHTVSQDARPGVVRWLPTGLRGRLRAAGVFGRKHIPDIYQFASRDQRLALLQGLMDTDGHATVRGTCTFVQRDRHLCEQVALLIRSLGVSASVTEQADSRSTTGSICKVHFSPDFDPFRLERKSRRGTWGRRTATWWPAISAIEPVPSVPVKCIAVDSPDHLFLVGRGLHLTHNTHRHTSTRLKEAYQTMKANLPKRKIADSWMLEITTAPEPGSGSIAEATMEYAHAIHDGRIKDSTLFFFHRQAGDEHDLSTEEGARAAVLEASGPAASWRDIDGILADWKDPTTDRAYWERVWCNRLVKGASQAFDVPAFRALADTRTIPTGALITIGFDGAQFHDSTAIVCTDVESGYQWVAGLWERPATLPKEQPWQVPASDVDACMRDLFGRYDVWRLYADPPYWQSWIAQWRGDFGDEQVIEWLTNRRRQMAAALENFDTAIKERRLSHSGDPRYIRHLANARRVNLTQLDEQGRPLWLIQKDRPDSTQKIDCAMAGILSWEARTDAVSAGAMKASVYLTRGVVSLGA